MLATLALTLTSALALTFASALAPLRPRSHAPPPPLLQVRTPTFHALALLSAHADGLRLHATLRAALYTLPPHVGGGGGGAAGARVSALATQSATQPARLHVSFVHVHPLAETSLDLEMRGVVHPLTLPHPLYPASAPCHATSPCHAAPADEPRARAAPLCSSSALLCTPSAPLLHPSAPFAGRRDAHQRAAAHRPEHRQLQQRGHARRRRPIGPTLGRRAGGGRPSPPSAAAAAQHCPGGAPRRLAAATAARLRVRRARARCSAGVGGRHCRLRAVSVWGSFLGAAKVTRMCDARLKKSEKERAALSRTLPCSTPPQRENRNTCRARPPRRAFAALHLGNGLPLECLLCTK